MTQHVEEMQGEDRSGPGYNWPKGNEHPKGEAKDTSPLANGGNDTESVHPDAAKADDAAPPSQDIGIPSEGLKVHGGSAGDGMPPTHAKADTTEAPSGTSDFVNVKKARKEKSVDPDEEHGARMEKQSFSRTMGDGTPARGNHRNVMGSGEVTPKVRGVMGHGENEHVRAKGVMGRDI